MSRDRDGNGLKIFSTIEESYCIKNAASRLDNFTKLKNETRRKKLKISYYFKRAINL